MNLRETWPTESELQHRSEMKKKKKKSDSKWFLIVFFYWKPQFIVLAHASKNHNFFSTFRQKKKNFHWPQTSHFNEWIGHLRFCLKYLNGNYILYAKLMSPQLLNSFGIQSMFGIIHLTLCFAQFIILQHIFIISIEIEIITSKTSLRLKTPNSVCFFRLQLLTFVIISIGPKFHWSPHGNIGNGLN